MSRILLSNVVENEDEYKWSELNCFYKVFAIVLSSSCKKFFDYFLMYVSAYILYGIKGRGHLSFDSGDCVLEYYRRELQPVFGNKITNVEFGGYRNFVKKLYDELSENNVVIIPCDLFYLPYSKSYMELHKRHYLIVKGIDKEKGIVYVLDNMHVELGASTIYKDFMLDIKVVYNMADAFRRNFENVSNKSFFWSIGGNINNNFEIDNNEYFLKLKENILSDNACIELNILENEEYCDMSMEKYLSYANLRVVFYTTLKNSITDDTCKELLDNILKEWNNIKLELSYRKSENVKAKVLRNIENEKKCIKECYILNDKANALEMYEYKIINKKNVPISCDKNIININLDKNRIYDIWSNTDNGVIVINEEAVDKCSATMKIDTEFGSSSHCGIYLELDNGSRFLFGSLGRLNMAVHAIDNKENYELCIYQEIIEEKMYIEIKYDNEFCYFYSGYDKRCRYTLRLDSNVAKVGFFAKTWENCDCNVSIDVLI